MTCGCSSDSITESSTVMPLLSLKIKKSYAFLFNASLVMLTSTSLAFNVPLTLSIQKLGADFTPQTYHVPVTHQGLS